VGILGVLAAFRGQRITNANRARDRNQEAFAEARMVVVTEILEVPAKRGSNTQLALVLTIKGSHAIIDVHSQVWVATKNAQLGPMLGIEPVLAPGQQLALHQPPIDIADDLNTRLHWQVSWTDHYGYRWHLHRDRHDKHPLPGMLQRPTGRGPTGPPTRWHRIRNLVVPYDFWPTETVKVHPRDHR
jgi:hypothetical protein